MDAAAAKICSGADFSLSSTTARAPKAAMAKYLSLPLARAKSSGRVAGRTGGGLMVMGGGQRGFVKLSEI
jgi:hypothetical protein